MISLVDANRSRRPPTLSCASTRPGIPLAGRWSTLVPRSAHPTTTRQARNRRARRIGLRGGRLRDGTAFGGTSGAAPMVTGAAALVLQGNRKLKPYEVKARLMNNAKRDVYSNAV